MRQLFSKYILWGMALFTSLFFTSCPHRVLLSRKQLLGADPSKDLMAAPILRHFRSQKARAFSVRGVRLLDPLDRVQALWGKPSRRYKNQHYWLDSQGNYLYRILIGHFVYRPPHAKSAINRVVVRQIDVFSSAINLVHPKNKELFSVEKIESGVWRKKVFGVLGHIHKEKIQTRYLFSKQGIQLLLLSKLIPLEEKIQVALSFFLSRHAMTQLRVIPIR